MENNAVLLQFADGNTFNLENYEEALEVIREYHPNAVTETLDGVAFVWENAYEHSREEEGVFVPDNAIATIINGKTPYTPDKAVFDLYDPDFRKEHILDKLVDNLHEDLNNFIDFRNGNYGSDDDPEWVECLNHVAGESFLSGMMQLSEALGFFADLEVQPEELRAAIEIVAKAAGLGIAEETQANLDEEKNIDNNNN